MSKINEEGLTAEEFHRYARGRSPSRHCAYLCRKYLSGPGPFSLLDVGCGAGFALKQISEAAGKKVRSVGCDADPEMLGYAAHEIGLASGGTAALVANSARALPFADAAFDVVFSEGSLHHFDDPRAMLSEMWRALKPGGRLLIVDLNPAAPAARAYAGFVWIKKALGLASKGEAALMESIRHAIPAGETEGMFEQLGIRCRVARSVASIYYESEKPRD
jgi:ubiquinone/menaquinone biosynthesis C-methylase UbiE